MAWGGQFENQQRAAARLAGHAGGAGLIFLLLFSTFGSVRQALLVLSNIPFALVGGIVALWVSGRVPVGAGLGRLHRAAGHRRAQRRGAGQLLQPAACGRLPCRMRDGGRQTPAAAGADDRAITAFGLMPLLFASGPGSEIQRPLAIVVIGGLITATALTLMLLPILYRASGSWRGGSTGRSAGRAARGRHSRTLAP
jgi:cobalt-zinc-cadmium resistance protein CzcA